MNTKRKLDKAKVNLVIEQPFFATIVCGLEVIESPHMTPPTMGTDGKVLRYHPQWVDDHTDRECSWALCHETMHCALQHMFTRGSRDPYRWNVAADIVINQLLDNDGIHGRPKEAWFEPALFKLGGGTTEGVYNILPEDIQGGAGDGWDLVIDFNGDPSEAAEAEAMWKVRLSQAANVARVKGKLSATMERFIGELMNPKVPWEEVLRRFCMRNVRSDRSFARPSRRHLSSGQYLPGLSGYGMGGVLIAVDQSGSVDEAELTKFGSEMKGVQEDGNPACLDVLYFASHVMKHDHFEGDEPVIVAPNGTGGTAFSPIFAFAADHGIQPDCAVILTDLYCSDFGPQPDYPVLWITTGALEAPWGEVISIRD